MDSETAPVAQVTQHPVRHPPEADLKSAVVLDQTRGISRDPLGHLARRLVDVLDQRGVDRHETRDPVDRDAAVAGSARHRRIDLGDHRARREHGSLGHIDRDSQAARAVRVGGRNLDQRDIEWELPVGEQPRHLGHRHRDVLHLS